MFTPARSVQTAPSFPRTGNSQGDSSESKLISLSMEPVPQHAWVFPRPPLHSNSGITHIQLASHRFIPVPAQPGPQFHQATCFTHMTGVALREIHFPPSQQTFPWTLHRKLFAISASLHLSTQQARLHFFTSYHSCLLESTVSLSRPRDAAAYRLCIQTAAIMQLHSPPSPRSFLLFRSRAMASMPLREVTRPVRYGRRLQC